MLLLLLALLAIRGVLRRGVVAQVEFESKFRKRFVMLQFQELNSRRFQRGFDRVNLHRLTGGACAYCACCGCCCGGSAWGTYCCWGWYCCCGGCGAGWSAAGGGGGGADAVGSNADAAATVVGGGGAADDGLLGTIM